MGDLKVPASIWSWCVYMWWIPTRL